MPLLRFSVWSAMLGAAIALMFLATLSAVPINYRANRDMLMLALYPTSIVLLAPQPPTLLFIASIIANGLLYGVVGSFLWLGANKHFLYFFVALGMAVGAWWLLLGS